MAVHVEQQNHTHPYLYCFCVTSKRIISTKHSNADSSENRSCCSTLNITFKEFPAKISHHFLCCFVMRDTCYVLTAISYGREKKTTLIFGYVSGAHYIGYGHDLSQIRLAINKGSLFIRLCLPSLVVTALPSPVL